MSVTVPPGRQEESVVVFFVLLGFFVNSWGRFVGPLPLWTPGGTPISAEPLEAC